MKFWTGIHGDDNRELALNWYHCCVYIFFIIFMNFFHRLFSPLLDKEQHKQEDGGGWETCKVVCVAVTWNAREHVANKVLHECCF